MLNDPKQTLEVVRQTAANRLQKISRNLSPPKASYLLKEDQYCGVRFRLGFFRADWMLGDSVVNVYRDDQRIDTLPLVAVSESRAA